MPDLPIYIGKSIKSLFLALLLASVCVPVQANNQQLTAAKDAIAKGDLHQGAKMLAPLARKGDAEAQYLLGRAYNHGEGVDADPVQAVKWLERAANQMHYAASNTLGKIYASGMGVKMDADLAAKWFAQAADIAEQTAQEHEDCD